MKNREFNNILHLCYYFGYRIIPRLEACSLPKPVLLHNNYLHCKSTQIKVALLNTMYLNNKLQNMAIHKNIQEHGLFSATEICCVH